MGVMVLSYLTGTCREGPAVSLTVLELANWNPSSPPHESLNSLVALASVASFWFLRIHAAFSRGIPYTFPPAEQKV